MATLTFTGDDGMVQTFDLGVISTPTPAPTVTEVDVKESDGSEETFDPSASSTKSVTPS